GHAADRQGAAARARPSGVDAARRKEPVEARVRRPRDPVDRARQDALFPDDRGEGGGEGAWIARRRRAGRRHGGLVRLLPARGAGGPPGGGHPTAGNTPPLSLGEEGG